MAEIILSDPLVLGAFLAACALAIVSGLLLLVDVLAGRLDE